MKMILACALSITLSAQEFEPNITVETFAGSRFFGHVDGVGEMTQFYQPSSLAFTPDGDLLVLESEGYVRKISKDRTVTTYAQNIQLSGALAFGETMYLANFSKIGIFDNGVFSVFSGSALSQGWKDSESAGSVRFEYPSGMAILNDWIYIADRGNNRIRKTSAITGATTTFIGSGNRTDIDGRGVFSSLADPVDVAISGGYLFIACGITARKANLDTGDVFTIMNGQTSAIAAQDDICFVVSGSKIVVVRPDGRKSLIGGEQSGDSNGPASMAAFYAPGDIVVGSDGFVYVADTFNHKIRRFKINSPTPPLPLVALKNYAGISVTGAIGRTYRVEAAASPDATDWQTVGQITLTKSPQTWFDEESPGQAKRFYRAVLIP